MLDSLPQVSEAKQFCVVVVLYNMAIEQCPTLLSLVACSQQLHHSKVIVWDNSPVALPETELKKLEQHFGHFEYISTPENVSLSCLYNRVYKENAAYRWMAFFDQDSTFGNDYFDEIKRASSAHPQINLFVPVIRHNGRIMSPGNLWYFKGFYKKNIATGANRTGGMCVVTSGICVAMRYLQNEFAGFNEKLHFYGIDTYFSLQYRQQNREYFVMRCSFDHSLSIHVAEAYNARQRRFQNHLQSLRIISREFNILVRTLAELYFAFETVKFRLKTRKEKDARIT